MMTALRIRNSLEAILGELHAAYPLHEGKLVVIGASTSRVQGKWLGKSGDESIAEALCQGLQRMQEKYKFSFLIQCCEHLNRSLVTEAEVARRWNLTCVHALPTMRAGGALAACVFAALNQPVLVESVQADCGLDIGGTMIGMHLRPVAVPIHLTVSKLEQANVTAAYTRPKLIGGVRARYE